MVVLQVFAVFNESLVGRDAVVQQSGRGVGFAVSAGAVEALEIIGARDKEDGDAGVVSFGSGFNVFQGVFLGGPKSTSLKSL